MRRNAQTDQEPACAVETHHQEEGLQVIIERRARSAGRTPMCGPIHTRQNDGSRR